MNNKRTEKAIYGSVTAELSALYEISSLSFSDSEENLVEEAMEKAVRLFGVHYFALFTGHQLAASWGFRNEEEAWQKMKQNEPNQFHFAFAFAFAFGKEGEQGELFMEQAHPIDDRKRRLYTIFARRLENALLTTRSIMERSRVSEALRKSEEKYRATFEHTGTCMAILEEDATISLVNSQFEELSGYSKEEIEGKMRWTKFVHPDDVERMLEYHKKRRQNPEGVPKEYEFREVNKRGDIFNMLIGIDMIPGTKKTVISLVDITEQKRREDFIANLVRSVPVPMSVMTVDGRRTDTNRAAEKYFRRSREEIVGARIEDLYSKEDAERIKNAVEECKSADAEFSTCEATCLRGDGSTFPAILNFASVKDGKGKIINLLVTAQDVTELKQVEEELAKIVEGSPIPAFVINSEHKIAHWNTAIETLTGVKREEVIGTEKQWLPFYVHKRPVMADLIVDEAPESEFKVKINMEINIKSLL
jgi:PAS domain S-box-containing protein